MSNRFDTDGDGVIDSEEEKFVQRRINTQRKIAIWAFVGIMLMGFGLPLAGGIGFLSPELIESFSTYLGWFFSILGAIVLGYAGLEASSIIAKK